MPKTDPLLIRNASFSTGGERLRRNLLLDEGLIAAAEEREDAARVVIDADGLLVLPGLVDIHGDAFERQIMPRPGVGFDLELALDDTERQLAANGITTAFHGVTCSWEPGLRGIATVRRLIRALSARKGTPIDTRVHLRHETFNLDAEAETVEWIEAGLVHMLAFNDHMNGTLKDRFRPEKKAKMVERTGLDADAFDALVERVHAREADVDASVARLARAARAASLTMLSHDDRSPAERTRYRDMGASIAEFPITEETAAAASQAGDPIVFGAPNVVRGGSHTGCPDAAAMVEAGFCTVLASDYYYPALLAAPFVLAARSGRPVENYWPLVSENPARAAGLIDRGRIEPGMRADVVLVDPCGPRPAVVATIAAGRLVHLSDAARIAAAGVL